MLKKMVAIATCAIFYFLLILPVIAGVTDVFTGKPSELEKFGYLVRDAAWDSAKEGGQVIFVCWENPNEDNRRARELTQDQIQRTWESHSALIFRGWQKCAPENVGIRILYEDSGPHVKHFGKEINGVINGMVLNHKFDSWKPACPFDLETCIKSIAVHEFGHALGFAHEQNRPDTPGECAAQHGQDQPFETVLTPYDPLSVMNYCNDKNDGTLSKLDKMAVRNVYGKRTH